jgi:hypothetical protein
MHYHLVTTDGDGHPPGVRTVTTAADAERDALRAAVAWGDWAPKRYPGRTWKRGEVAVYLDRTATATRAPMLREVSVIRCTAGTPEAPECLLRGMGVPALNLEAAEAATPAAPAAERPALRGQRAS